jgi:thymidine kinase
MSSPTHVAASAQGFLHLIVGPMFSGKSTELIRHIRRYRSIGKRLVIINHTLNNRYESTGVTTHSAMRLEDEVLVMSDLTEMRRKHSAVLAKVDIVCIEELQFFEDALDTITYLTDVLHKTVIAAGLLGDYRRDPCTEVLSLMPHADIITHLSALCSECNDGTPGIFSKRISKNLERTLIGSTDMYRAVCRHHYSKPEEGGARERRT